MFRSISMILVLGTAALACTEEDPQTPDAGTNVVPDGGNTNLPDASEPPPDAGEPGELIFEAVDPAGAALVFKNAVVAADTLTVEVAGRALADVHGVAFRVAYDPAVLTFGSMENLAVFPVTGLERVREARPGLLVVALGRVGGGIGVPIDDVSVARLHFNRVTEASTAVRIERGFALDARGLDLKVASGSGNLRQN